MAALTATSGCQRDERFPALGDRIASPVAIVTGPDEQHFYVLNADFDRTYNAGSIVVIDADGNKKAVVPVPRLGRTLSVSGTSLLVTFDSDGTSSGPQAILFDLSDAANPVEVKRIDMPCNPLNVVMRDGYKYFAVACEANGDTGSLAIGILDGANTVINLVRSYGTARRAMHIDVTNELLFAFPTDFGLQTWMDLDMDDAVSYGTDGSQTAQPNEIPDEYEKTRRARSNTGQRRIFQFVVYDLKAEAQASPEAFPFRPVSDKQVESEFRWIYFNPQGFGGLPDSDAGLTSTTATRRYYRTNFFSAAHDPEDGAAFYLSHRGHVDAATGIGSPHANDVLRVSLTGDPRPAADGTVPKTSTYLGFERVYGRGNEDHAQGLHYPGDIAVRRVAGQKMLFVNHFRDLVNWTRSQVYFAVAAKTLGNDYWHSEKGSADPYESYYQMAVTKTGRMAACSFYGSKVILFDVLPGAAINERLSIQ
ncbi:MAG: hypothetical protein RIQ81_2463 [Pseudomonadota bacterium]|jgi:hypothetical protein